MSAFTVSVTGIDEALRLFDPAVVQSSVTRTLNELGKKSKTIITKAITNKYNIKQKDLAENSTGHSRLKMYAAARGTDVVSIEASGRSISMAYFGATQVTRTATGYQMKDRKGSRFQKRTKMSQGVTVEINKGDKTALRNAFISKVNAGTKGFHTGVFNRYGKSRLPIFEKRVITIASMVDGSDSSAAIHKLVDDEFSTILVRNLNWYGSK